MRLAKFTTALVMGLAVTACATTKASIKSMKGDPNNTVGTLMVWDNDMNAGVANKSGVCIQRAMTSKLTSAEGSADVPTDLVAALQTTATNSDSTSAASVSGAIAQAALMLSTTTERTAFIDIGLFYICQLGLNQSIEPAQAAALTETLIRSAAAITPVETEAVRASSPDLGDGDGDAANRGGDGT